MEDKNTRRKSIYEVEQRPSAIDYELAGLREEIAELRDDVKGLLEAWNGALWVIKVIKVTGSIAALVAAVISLFDHGVNIK